MCKRVRRKKGRIELQTCIRKPKNLVIILLLNIIEIDSNIYLLCTVAVCRFASLMFLFT